MANLLVVILLGVLLGCITNDVLTKKIKDGPLWKKCVCTIPAGPHRIDAHMKEHLAEFEVSVVQGGVGKTWCVSTPYRAFGTPLNIMAPSEIVILTNFKDSVPSMKWGGYLQFMYDRKFNLSCVGRCVYAPISNRTDVIGRVVIEQGNETELQLSVGINSTAMWVATADKMFHGNKEPREQLVPLIYLVVVKHVTLLSVCVLIGMFYANA